MVDSKPLPICEHARNSQSTICQEIDYALPDYGYFASKRKHYKLHSVHTFEGVIAYPDLAPARTYDSKVLSDIQGKLFNSLLITDKGYVSEGWQEIFLAQNNVLLCCPKRKNQACAVRFIALFDYLRRQIERIYAQLKDQFLIERNHAKSFWVYKTRILNKATALTMVQYLNKRSAPNFDCVILQVISSILSINSHNPLNSNKAAGYA